MDFEYQSGFGNDFETEAVKGSLPVGRNSPQRPPKGLYPEQFSGTAFTAPRHLNRRTWKYRIRPSVLHGPYEQTDGGLFLSGPFDQAPTPPDQLRWGAMPFPDEPSDFVDGMMTIAGNGDPFSQTGIAIHIFAATKSMEERFFQNSDGEMLIVAEANRVRFETELGILEIEPGEIAVIPRGLKFRVVLPDGKARGYVCENYGSLFHLPELGPIGSNGLANSRDFLAPVAWYEDLEGDFEVINKFGGNFWRCEIGHSPLDVVGWHGNNVPYKYDLRRFNTIGSISFDHPDPSIFTVLTSASGEPGVANCDFVIFPDRWLVMEDTFKPPWFHRNTMSEYMGLVYGAYDAKEDGFVPGGSSIHNQMSAHGPDAEGYLKATNAPDEPLKLSDTMAFMFESRYIIRPTEFALNHDALDSAYRDCWKDLKRNFKP